MNNGIDWRAFWTSVGTMMLVLIVFYILIEPLIRVYKIQVVSEDKKETKKVEEVKKV